MKRHRILYVLLFASLAVSASPAQPSPLERSRQARMQIDALLGPRRNPPPPPADPANPFTVPGVAAAPDSGPSNPSQPEAIPSEQETLARCLKISGTAMVGGKQQLIVNQQAYKEGDLIAVRDGDIVLRVRLVRIASPSAVFELNGNEVILSIRN